MKDLTPARVDPGACVYFDMRTRVSNLGTLAPPLLFSLLCTVLVACGASDEYGNTVYVSGVSQNLRVSKSGPFHLDVAGHGHDVHVESGSRILMLLVAGSNHKIHVPSGVSIDEIELNGVRNRVYVPRGFQTKLRKFGSQNELIER